MVIWASLCRENKIKLQPGFFCFVLFFLPVAPAKLYLVNMQSGENIDYGSSDNWNT